MTAKNSIVLFAIIAAIFVTIFSLVLFQASLVQGQSVGQGTFHESVNKYATSTKVTVGTSVVSSLYTTVAPASPGRTYLEITNLSGATSTAQALYCKVGEIPVKYEGIVIHASSTRTWEDGHIPTGAVKCIFPHASSTVAVTEK